MPFIAETSTQTAIPYAIALLCLFAGVLYIAFAPGSVIVGSIQYTLFGTYLAPFILSGLICAGLIASLPTIADRLGVNFGKLSNHDTGFAAAVLAALIVLLFGLAKVANIRRETRKRGGLV